MRTNKAKRNERIKLKAGYWNNLAVSMYIGGCVIPYLAFSNQYFIDRLILHQPPKLLPIFIAGTLALMAATAGIIFRRKADSIIQTLEG